MQLKIDEKNSLKKEEEMKKIIGILAVGLIFLFGFSGNIFSGDILTEKVIFEKIIPLVSDLAHEENSDIKYRIRVLSITSPSIKPKTAFLLPEKLGKQDDIMKEYISAFVICFEKFPYRLYLSKLYDSSRKEKRIPIWVELSRLENTPCSYSEVYVCDSTIMEQDPRFSQLSKLFNLGCEVSIKQHWAEKTKEIRDAFENAFK